jgi:hypothetical protein
VVADVFAAVVAAVIVFLGKTGQEYYTVNLKVCTLKKK